MFANNARTEFTFRLNREQFITAAIALSLFPHPSVASFRCHLCFSARRLRTLASSCVCRLSGARPGDGLPVLDHPPLSSLRLGESPEYLVEVEEIGVKVAFLHPPLSPLRLGESPKHLVEVGEIGVEVAFLPDSRNS